MIDNAGDALQRLSQLDADLGIDGDIHIDQAVMFVREARDNPALDELAAEGQRLGLYDGTNSLIVSGADRSVAASARNFLDIAFGEPDNGCR